MEIIKLKPCPFCGENPQAIRIKGKDGWRDRYTVRCPYDHGGCGAEGGMYHSEAEAVEAWNKRYSDQNAEPGKMAMDCISRKMVSEGLAKLARNKFSLADSYGFYLNGLKDADYLVSHLPPAKSELIRCRDCHWWTKQDASLQGRCALSGTYPTGAWYCANARKRGEADGSD